MTIAVAVRVVNMIPRKGLLSFAYRNQHRAPTKLDAVLVTAMTIIHDGGTRLLAAIDATASVPDLATGVDTTTIDDFDGLFPFVFLHGFLIGAQWIWSM